MEKTKKEFKLIETGQLGKKVGKRDMVFSIIYTKTAQPYLYYRELPEKDRPMNIPLVLIQARWDGKLGFCGGHVDTEDKSLKEAVLREMYEEINFDANMDNLVPFKTFANEKVHIHSFLYEVDEKKIKKIYRNSQDADHFGAENCGSIIMQIHEKSIPALMKGCWSGTAKEELKAFITEILGMEVKENNK